MEKFILRDRTSNIEPERLHAKYLKKYCESDLGQSRIDPVVPFLTQVPARHEQILQKCLEQQEREGQHRSRLSRMGWLSPSNTAANSTKSLELDRLFRRTTKLKLQPSRDGLRRTKLQFKQASLVKTQQGFTPLIYKKTSPPIGYYDANYSQVHRKSPGVRMTTSNCQDRKLPLKELTELAIKYNLVQPRPVLYELTQLTFNMGKQRSREHQPRSTKQNKENGIPDVRTLELEYEFNARQQKKYPMRIPCTSFCNVEALFRLELSGNKIPYTQNEINSINLEMLKKYNFSESDKKFLYFKKLSGGG